MKLLPLTPIFLIGFMGSGKTTFGKRLAAKLGRSFIDLDKAVCEMQEVDSVKDLIETKGLDFFRQTEAETLRSLSLREHVIATGGGTPCYFDNIQWMKAKGTVLFLNVDEGIIFSRLKTTDLEERPLLKNLDDEGLRKFIHDKMEERLPFYLQADLHFNPTKETMEQLLTYFPHAKEIEP